MCVSIPFHSTNPVCILFVLYNPFHPLSLTILQYMFDPKAKAKEKDEDKDNEDADDESGKCSWQHHNLIPSITTAAAAAVSTVVTTVENLFCEFCKHSWQSRRDYDKHLHCCRFFFQSKKRLTGTGTSSSSFYHPPQMDEHGNKVPSALEMFKLVQNLSERLVRTEKETKRLREIVSRRQRQQLTEWLVTQQPSVSFDAWMHDLVIDEAMLHVVFERDLTEGIKATIEMNMQLFDQWKMSTAFETAFQRRREGRDVVTPGFWNKMTPSFSMGQTTMANRTSSRPTTKTTTTNTNITTTIEESPPAVPIPAHFTGIRPLRAFAQRPNTLYVYSTMGDTLPEPTWCILENKQLETLVIRISQMLLREFLQWQKREEQKEKERKAAKIGKENLKSDQNQNPNSNSNQLNAEMMDVVEEQEQEQEQEDWYAKREEEEREERMLRYMIKINGSRVSMEKRVSEIRRWLLPRLEENIRMMVVDFD